MASISSAGSIALSGIAAANTQVAVAASNIANSESTGQTAPTQPFGSSAVVSIPTGTQPNNAAGQVFQALNVVSVAQPNGGVTTTIETSSSNNGSGPGDNTAQQLVDLASAQQAFESNVATLKASELLNQSAVNLIA